MPAVSALALLAAAPLQAAAPIATARAAPGMVERTYLKAQPGRREALARYIEANWFAMDRIATERGLFRSYALHANANADAAADADPPSGAAADWDLVVTVRYASDQGYADPATRRAFDAIRAAHREILIDGRGLRDLGAVVRHERLRALAASTESDRED